MLGSWLLTIPFLGAIADKDGRRKPWVLGTAIMSVASIGLLLGDSPAGIPWSIPRAGSLLFMIYTAFPS